jgi:hypothetical protein
MMKKLFFLIVAVLILTSSFGTSNIFLPKGPKASELFIPVGNTGKKISLQELSTINMGDLQMLTGKKISFSEKVSFKIAQRKLRNSIAPDGTIESKKFERLLKNRGGETGFHAGGFFLGLILGLIGVLIAYLIKDDYKRNRVKWAWIGWGVWLVILLIALAAGL